ncbi:MAG TPA: hypothetical protein VGV59_13230 [Pyrinomonadaceae bacterium]|nr:hypothetical protein [Pyrinomonadaceae bacterium]
MAEPNDVAEEARRLEELLSTRGLRPPLYENALKEFSEASKNELVTQLKQRFNPPPLGRLLMQLLDIRTPENEADLTTLYITNLRSPNEDARGASLHGLNELNHPLIVDFALSALRDDNDYVLFEASTILLLKAGDDPHIRKILQDVYASHAGDPKFHMTINLLEPLAGS